MTASPKKIRALISKKIRALISKKIRALISKTSLDLVQKETKCANAAIANSESFDEIC